MAKYANKVVAQAQAWLGRKESNGSHKEIIDVYNSHKPLARGYAVKYTDSWCATFVSAVAIKLGYTDIIPTECGCEKQIDLFKKLGCWIESDSYIPKAGDIIYYDWNDSGLGDNKGYSDHVGIVEKVSGNNITAIEGNKNNAVERRNLAVNGRYIRGYGVPKYDKEVVSKPVAKPAAAANPCADWTTYIKSVQKALGVVVDGYAGPVTLKACPTLKKNVNKKVNVLIPVQNRLNYIGHPCGTADGYFGDKTLAAVKAFQKANKLTVDGIIGPQTWKKLLGIK